MGAAEVVAILRANTSEFTAKMGEAEAQVTKLTKASASNFEKMAAVGKAATLALGAAAIGVGVIAVDLGNKSEDAQAQMVNAFKNAGTSTDAYKVQIAAVDTQLTKYGYSNATTNSAIARLVTVTGNAKTALGDMGLAADIAKSRHIDLASATDLLAKTMAGNITAAKRMGIEIPPEILKIKDPLQKANDITAILEARFKGSASAAAGTFSGRMETLKAQGENVAASIGQKLIPILEKLVTWVSNTVEYFKKHQTEAKALAVVLGTVLVAAIGTFVAAFVAGIVTADGAAATLDAALGGIPILLGLLVVGILYVSTHWKQVWSDIKTWVAEGAAWVREHFYIIMAIPIVGWMIELAANWKGIWNIIQSAVQVVWSVIGPIFNFFKTLGTDFIIANIQLLQGIWNAAWPTISAAVKFAWESVIKPAWDLLQPAITAIQTTMSALQTAWSTAWDAIGSAVQWAWVHVIKPAIDPIVSAIDTVKSGLADIGIGGGGGKPAPTGGLGAQAASAAAAAGTKLSGKPFAAGGNPPVGMASLVGENGPELFVPSSSGTIIPNGALTGGGGQMAQVTSNVIIDGEVLASVTRTHLLRLGRNVPTLGFP